jgi:hypothetical protein
VAPDRPALPIVALLVTYPDFLAPAYQTGYVLGQT